MPGPVCWCNNFDVTSCSRLVYSPSVCSRMMIMLTPSCLHKQQISMTVSRPCNNMIWVINQDEVDSCSYITELHCFLACGSDYMEIEYLVLKPGKLLQWTTFAKRSSSVLSRKKIRKVSSLLWLAVYTGDLCAYFQCDFVMISNRAWNCSKNLS